ncbi:hypothetical protein K8B33_05135 [Alcanivorax sp. JB21]|uniref:hypothetical protein n=1 Tax=Alcanivorax limicola TaxID=2874102 RepID=UPI001CC056ED|nr:hypothetical protein [Alcanivorax limicola]MBZ2188468.1 hypothetical protein [Alcanivorax limicola]
MTALAWLLAVLLWLSAAGCLLHPRIGSAITLLQVFFALLALSWWHMGLGLLGLAELIIGTGLIGLLCHRSTRWLNRQRTDAAGPAS